jgi:hypothetical protein
VFNTGILYFWLRLSKKAIPPLLQKIEHSVNPATKEQKNAEEDSKDF